jgi:hypothetical protein
LGIVEYSCYAAERITLKNVSIQVLLAEQACIAKINTID